MPIPSSSADPEGDPRLLPIDAIGLRARPFGLSTPSHSFFRLSLAPLHPFLCGHVVGRYRPKSQPFPFGIGKPHPLAKVFASTVTLPYWGSLNALD
jgi:hypothetical protein